MQVGLIMSPKALEEKIIFEPAGKCLFKSRFELMPRQYWSDYRGL